MRIVLAALLSLALFAPAVALGGVTPPAEFLGRPVGADFELADWNEVSSWFRLLSQQSSRVDVSKVGATTEGRDFLLAVISSESNLARLDEIREQARLISDPRGLSEQQKAKLIEEATPVLFISCAMHATETAAPQMAMELAYQLATAEDGVFARAREEMVILIAPSLNPDGLDHVVSWYRETVGTPYEATSLLKLYQYYAGHDNNRDWFGLTQAETRIVTRLLYSEWRPQVYWDVHQQGRQRERFFVPPYRDPLNPNLDPGIIAGIGALGGRALFDMTAEGFAGISTGVTYDMWWNGGNRNVPVRHNVIGILTEAASVKLASPVFLEPDSLRAPRSIQHYGSSNRFPMPWRGGWWRLRDIIDYELGFARSLLGSLSREPETWLANAMGASERAMARGEREGPRAWVIPSDQADRGAVRRLCETLLLGGVEIHVAGEGVSGDGRNWPKGSLVISMAQPYGTHVRDLFEIQRYPEGAPPYDVAGWTLPLLFGVHRVAVMEKIATPGKPVRELESLLVGFGGRARRGLLDSQDSDAWDAAIAASAKGEGAALAVSGSVKGAIKVGSTARSPGWRNLRAQPRVGLYSPWSGVKNEGWARWVFDTHGLPYVTVRNEMLRAGRLSDFLDVLVLPGLSSGALDDGRKPGTVHPEYSRGLDPEGAVAIEEFVRAGGTLVTLGRSSSWAIDLFELPLTDVTREKDTEFSCPGGVLRALPEDSDWTAGLPESVSLFFSRSSAWSLPKPKKGEPPAREMEVLLRYAPTRVLLSGWVRSPETIENQAAWVRAKHGDGQVHLFGFRPQYRGWSQDAFELLYRAILLAP